MSGLRSGLFRIVLVAGLAGPGLLASNVLAAGFAARADEPEAFDVQTRGALRDVITKQLAAFGRDDGTEAEKFASPALREKFPDPAGFLDMVKENYAPLVKPRSTHFEETSDSPHGPLQKMTVVASDGTVWTVVYAFERVDGEWRISGCGIMKQESQDI
jgi:hypothetical protein